MHLVHGGQDSSSLSHHLLPRLVCPGGKLDSGEGPGLQPKLSEVGCRSPKWCLNRCANTRPYVIFKLTLCHYYLISFASFLSKHFIWNAGIAGKLYTYVDKYPSYYRDFCGDKELPLFLNLSSSFLLYKL